MTKQASNIALWVTREPAWPAPTHWALYAATYRNMTEVRAAMARAKAQGYLTCRIERAL